MTKAWIKMKSSNIDAIRYNPSTEVLQVGFKSGAAYSYADVPANVYGAFLRSPSPGRFFHNEIRGVYSFEKHEPVSDTLDNVPS